MRNAIQRNHLKGRVSRFGACASDNVSAVKPIVFGLTGQCLGHVSERNKEAVHVKHMGNFAAPFRECPMTFKKCQNLCERIRFYFSTMSISRGIDLFLLRAVRKAEKLPQTYVLKSSISSAFSDKLTIVCTLVSLILLDQREGEEREIRKLQEAMRPFSNNNTERPSEMLECI